MHWYIDTLYITHNDVVFSMLFTKFFLPTPWYLNLYQNKNTMRKSKNLLSSIANLLVLLPVQDLLVKLCSAHNMQYKQKPVSPYLQVRTKNLPWYVSWLNTSHERGSIAYRPKEIEPWLSISWTRPLPPY